MTTKLIKKAQMVILFLLIVITGITKGQDEIIYQLTKEFSKPELDTLAIEGCSSAKLMITVNQVSENEIILPVIYSGNAMQRADMANLPANLIIQPGVDMTFFEIQPNIDNIEQLGLDTLNIEIKTTDTTSLFSTIYIKNNNNLTLSPEFTQFNICKGNEVQLEAFADGGINWLAYQYSWDFTEEQNNSIIVSPEKDSTYTLTVKDGCEATAKAIFEVKLNERPEINFSEGATRCGTGTLVLKATASMGKVNWYSSAFEGEILFTGDNFTTPEISETTTFYAQADNNNCLSMDRTAVEAIILAKPEVNLGKDTILLKEGSLILDAGEGFSTYLWNNDSTQQTIPVIAADLAEGSYEYTVTVTNEEGCKGSDNINIIIVNPEDNIVLALDSKGPNIGDTINLPLHVINFMNVRSFGIKLSYDNKKIKFLGIDNINPQIKGVFANTLTTNVITFIWGPTSEPANIAFGDLFNIKLVYKGGNSTINFETETEVLEQKTEKALPLKFINALIGLIILPEITGVVSYANDIDTPLSDINVSLINSEGKITGTTQTDSEGKYLFNNIRYGKYTVSVKTQIKGNRKVINPVDALIINKYYIGTYKITNPMRLKAADVNAKTGITILDALYINRYFLGIVKELPAGIWYFEKPTVNFEVGNTNCNIKGILYGDVDASYR